MSSRAPHRAGRLLGFLIMDSSSLLQARFHAAVKGLDRGAQFWEGHEIDKSSSALVPPDGIGRMLSLKKASRVIRRIER